MNSLLNLWQYVVSYTDFIDCAVFIRGSCFGVLSTTSPCRFIYNCGSKIGMNETIIGMRIGCTLWN
jgi:hypothetical protein